MTGQLDVIVIGAGHNGLTAAAYLARAGLQVLVLERRPVPGGAATTEEIFPGQRVDVCAHRVGGLLAPIVRDLNLGAHGVSIEKANPSVFAPTLDGDHITISHDPTETMRSIERHSRRDASRFSGFLELLDAGAQFVRALYSRPPIDLPRPARKDVGLVIELLNMFRRLDKRMKAEVLRMLPMSVTDLTEEWFESDIVQGTISAAGVTGLMQGPMANGTVYTLLHQHAMAEPGTLRPTYFVRGGTGRLTEGLAAAATMAGAVVRTESTVAKILVRDEQANGVVLSDGTELQARCVVSSLDPRTTALTLIDTVHLRPDVIRAARSIKFRGVCAKIHVMLGELPRFEGLPEGTDHLGGVISIAPSNAYLERAYDAAKYGEVSPSPFLELVIPTLADDSRPTSAPHVLSILAQYAPYHLADGTWNSTHADRLADTVLQALAEFAPNVPSAVLQRHVITPLDLEVDFGLTEGNIYHGDLTLDQVHFMRPIPDWSGYRTDIRGVYLCGAGTHAGGGVTCQAGYNAASVVARDLAH